MCANLNAEFKRVKNNKQEVVSGGQKVSEVDKKKKPERNWKWGRTLRKKLKVRKNTQEKDKVKAYYLALQQFIGLLYMRLRLKQVKGHLCQVEAHETHYGLYLDINYLFSTYICIT